MKRLKEGLKSYLPLPAKQWLFQRALSKRQAEWASFAQLHPGDRFACNFCNQTAGAFLTDGEDHPVLKKHKVLSGGIRTNSRCPHCGAKDRDRLIRFFLERATNLLHTEHRLLHFAPEQNLKTWFGSLNSVSVYKNVDLNPLAADEVMDITAISLADQSIDVVICNHVLEHIPDDLLAMREIYRVLAPGGWAILQVPISNLLDTTYENWDVKTPDEREIHFGQCDHVRIYGQDYVQRLTKVGFDVDLIEPEEFLSTAEIERYAILPEETIYYCKKPAL